MKKYYLLIILLLSILLFGLIYLWCGQHPEYDMIALMVANWLLAGLSVVSYFMLQSKLKAERPQVFVNGVYGSTLLRLMVCMGSIFVYLYLHQGHLHKPSIFAKMGLYIVYTVMETIGLTNMAKKK